MATHLLRVGRHMETNFPVLSPELFMAFRITCNIWSKGSLVLLHIGSWCVIDSCELL